MFKDLIELLSSRQVKVTHKGFSLIAIIFLALIVDNIIGFSYHYNNREKLFELEMISKLKGDNLLLEDSKQMICDIEKSLNERNNIFEYISSIRITSTDQEVPRNNLLLFFLTSWFSIFCAVVAFPVALISAPREEKDETKIFKVFFIPVLIVMIICTIISIVSYFLMDIIPMIGKDWTINYIIAFIFQPAITFIGMRIFLKRQNEKGNITRV